LGHNGLELGLRIRYVEDLYGVFSRSVYFGLGSAQLFESAHMHPRKNHTLNIRKVVITQQQKHSTFSNIAIIN